LNGIDLDDSEKVWSSLTDTEKAEFEHLVKSGDITKILPQNIPWWCLPYGHFHMIKFYFPKSVFHLGLNKNW